MGETANANDINKNTLLLGNALLVLLNFPFKYYCTVKIEHHERAKPVKQISR